jgi:sec-independent protein translocase protein TatA
MRVRGKAGGPTPGGLRESRPGPPPGFLFREGLMMFAPLGYFGMPGPLEMIIVAAIILLLFGNRLPSVMRSLGRGVVEFKKGISGIDDEIEDAVQGKKKDRQVNKD